MGDPSHEGFCPLCKAIVRVNDEGLPGQLECPKCRSTTMGLREALIEALALDRALRLQLQHEESFSRVVSHGAAGAVRERVELRLQCQDLSRLVDEARKEARDAWAQLEELRERYDLALRLLREERIGAGRLRWKLLGQETHFASVTLETCQRLRRERDEARAEQWPSAAESKAMARAAVAERDMAALRAEVARRGELLHHIVSNASPLQIANGGLVSLSRDWFRRARAALAEEDDRAR